jgi:hypothetical protein
VSEPAVGLKCCLNKNLRIAIVLCVAHIFLIIRTYVRSWLRVSVCSTGAYSGCLHEATPAPVTWSVRGSK